MPNLPFDFQQPFTQAASTPLSVAALSRKIEAALDQGLPMSVQVVGEVANHTVRNGHHYWSLRDDNARIDCVMWASDARAASVHAQDGARMVATGRVVHWGKGGRTQFKVRSMAMDGAGSRQAQLKARIDDFRSKGLLDPDRKRPLPSCPRRIAVLTARTGAAIHDVQATARRRFPGCGLLLIDVPVQGEAAAPRIAEAITRTSASAAQLGIDAIILTRGGGSIEDLWAFNELAPAMAVLDSVVPVVAAIGHESDTTLVELVADHRASTPTQAAMVLLPDREEMLARVQHTGRLLHRTVARLCQDAGAWLDGARRALDDGVHAMVRARRRRVQTCADAMHAMRPEARLARRRGQAEAMARRLGSAVAAQVRGKRHRVDRAITEPMVRQMVVRGQGRVDTLDRTLDALDPRHVLERGYTLTLTTEGTLVRSPEQVAHGELLHTRTAKGDIAVRVEPQAVPSDHGSQAD